MCRHWWTWNGSSCEVCDPKRQARWEAWVQWNRPKVLRSRVKPRFRLGTFGSRKAAREALEALGARSALSGLGYVNPQGRPSTETVLLNGRERRGDEAPAKRERPKRETKPSNEQVRQWYSPMPGECQLCHTLFGAGQKFIDGKTAHGPWGVMCETCHVSHGVGLGIGKGQEYTWRTP